MRKVKINHKLLGELQVEIDIDNCWVKLEGNDILCSLKNTLKKEPSLQFYDLKYVKKAGKKIGGLRITQNDYDMLKKVIAEEEEIKEKNEYNEFINQTSISYHTSYNFFMPAFLKKNYSNTVQNRVQKILEEKNIKTDTDYGEYSVTDTYKISGKELIELLDNVRIEVNKEKKEKEENENKRIEKIFTKAKETGEPQVLQQYSVECNDSDEACDIDIVVTYAMPDGSKKTERHHTW